MYMSIYKRYPGLLKKEELVYMDSTINMSERAMSSFLYACIMTGAKLTSTYTLSDSLDRKINSRNRVYLKVHLHPSTIEDFQIYSQAQLEKPQSISVNC